MNWKMIWHNFKEYEEHEMPWPIMMLFAFATLLIIATLFE